MAATESTPSRPEVLLLDTNILLYYARDGVPALRLESLLGLRAGRAQGLISVVTVGEINALALKLEWGRRRREQLAELIRLNLVPVDINRPEILDAYAEIDYFSQKEFKPARNMGKNDIWIAATAKVLGCELVTADNDFDHLHGAKLHRRWIDPASLK